MKSFFISVIICCGSLYTLSAQNAIPHLVKTFKVNGNGGWDYLAVQPSSNKLFLSHGTEVNIINKETGDSIGILKNLDGVHGIAFAVKQNKGYISNGRGNNIIVFDLATNTETRRITGGQNPDAIYYEPHINRIIVCNGKSKDISIIDPATDEVVATIAVAGRPETAVSNAKKLFVNLEDQNEIAVIDLEDLKLKQRFSLTPDMAPTGMAIDQNNNLLFTACSETKQLLVIDASDGKIIQRIAIGEDCDGVSFDKDKKMIYASNRGGTLTVIKQENKSTYVIKGNAITKYGARTITLDDATHKIYLPVADLKKSDGEERPKIIPGTFSVLLFDY